MRQPSPTKRNEDNISPGAKTTLDVSQVPMVYDSRSNIPPESIAYRWVASLGFDPLLILILTIIVIPGMFWLAGLAEARSKQTFYTFSRSGTEYLALRIFEEKVIAAPFAKDPCEHSQEFSLVLTKEITGLKPIQLKCLNRRPQSSAKPDQTSTP